MAYNSMGFTTANCLIAAKVVDLWGEHFKKTDLLVEDFYCFITMGIGPAFEIILFLYKKSRFKGLDIKWKFNFDDFNFD